MLAFAHTIAVSMPLLRVSDIALTIGEHAVLNGISFDVDEGRVVGLIGPNGSGKTTLFNVLSGFLTPSRGTVSFRGRDITRVGPAKRARLGIGRVFQSFGVFRDMTLAENVLVALEALPKERYEALGDVHAVVRAALGMAELQGHARKKAGSLSGGQMRLLEIARTLVCGNDLFLLDEPTAGVSPKMTGQVAAMIRRLKEQGKTVLVIEHDLPFIADICDETIVLDVGEIVLRGSPEEVRNSRKLKELYFGADPTS
jgi:branched-chain amino acid transport system ATP-binding protein